VVSGARSGLERNRARGREFGQRRGRRRGPRLHRGLRAFLSRHLAGSHLNRGSDLVRRPQIRNSTVAWLRAPSGCGRPGRLQCHRRPRAAVATPPDRRCPTTRTADCLATGAAGCLDTGTAGCLTTGAAGCLAAGTAGCLDTGTAGCLTPEPRLSRRGTASCPDRRSRRLSRHWKPPVVTPPAPPVPGRSPKTLCRLARPTAASPCGRVNLRKHCKKQVTQGQEANAEQRLQASDSHYIVPDGRDCTSLPDRASNQATAHSTRRRNVRISRLVAPARAARAPGSSLRLVN